MRKISLYLGVTLFFLVMTVLYLVFSMSDNESPLLSLQAFMPLVVFTGFFIFLIASILVALSIFEYLKKR